MQILKANLLSLQSEGRITLQVPDLYIAFTQPSPSDFINVPDDWLHYINHRNEPAVGKRLGFLYFTSVGYDHYKTQIKQAFLNSQCCRGTWQEFEQYAQEHFQNVAAKKHAAIIEASYKLNAAKQLGKNRSINYWNNLLQELQQFVV